MRVLSQEDAKEMRQRANFTRYQGPKLSGNRTILKKGGEGFPDALQCIPDPPEKLYVLGDPQVLTEGLAVIGARKATPYGLSCAKMFAEHAARRGVIVISGGAQGCDAAAHKAALEVGCPTVVFLGGGCDELYPAKHYELFQDIVNKGGALVSEHSWDYPPLRHTFRARNRLIAGLARATLIVEAGLPSGTFSTADEALCAGKEVLVVPGSICSTTSRGSNRLLYQGAMPIVDLESFEDALFSLFGVLKQQDCLKSDDIHAIRPHDSLYEALCANPMHMDEMLAFVKEDYRGNDPLGSLVMRLTELQRQCLIVRFSDGRYGPKQVV